MEIMSPREIGFTLLFFDPVDLLTFSKVGIVQFLFKTSPTPPVPRKKSQYSRKDGEGVDVKKKKVDLGVVLSMYPNNEQ